MKILRDTREQNGFDFTFYDVEVEDIKLDQGDYTTELLINDITVERKASTTEVSSNLLRKSSKDRFLRECDRIKNLKRGYLVLEFSESDVFGFPWNTKLNGLQKKKMRVTGRALYKMICEIEEQYPNIEIMYCNSREEAEKFTYDILSFWEKQLGYRSDSQ